MTITYGEIIEARSDAQAPAYGRTATGYGPKIPTRFHVRLKGDTARWRRVYAMAYGNAASLYVVRDGQDVFLRDVDLEVALA